MTKNPIKPATGKSSPKPATPSTTQQPAAAKPMVSKAGVAAKAKSGTATQTKPRQSNKAGQSKQDRVVAMLRRADGTTVAAVMKATGWQKHSVHGFFAGVVRKKFNLNLVSEVKGDERCYRIAEGKGGKAAPSSRKRAA